MRNSPQVATPVQRNAFESPHTRPRLRATGILPINVPKLQRVESSVSEARPMTRDAALQRQVGTPHTNAPAVEILSAALRNAVSRRRLEPMTPLIADWWEADLRATSLQKISSNTRVHTTRRTHWHSTNMQLLHPAKQRSTLHAGEPHTPRNLRALRHAAIQ